MGCSRRFEALEEYNSYTAASFPDAVIVNSTQVAAFFHPYLVLFAQFTVVHIVVDGTRILRCISGSQNMSTGCKPLHHMFKRKKGNRTPIVMRTSPMYKNKVTFTLFLSNIHQFVST